MSANKHYMPINPKFIHEHTLPFHIFLIPPRKILIHLTHSQNIHFNITGNEGQQKTILKQYEKWYGVDAHVIDMKLAMRLISEADARKWFEEHADDELGKELLPLTESNPPKQFALYENYPNPFIPGTTIAFDVPKDARVQVNVYNIRGQLVLTIVDESKAAGIMRCSGMH